MSGPPQRSDHATVVVVGAGPTGVTAAILLADAGVDVLVLDRFDDVYPRPRAVSLDDEVHRILARMGLAERFAAISRPALGLRLVDGADQAVLVEAARDPDGGVHGHPEASMFDQPELERVLRAGLARRPSARFRGDVEVTGVVPHELAAGVTVELTDRSTGVASVVTADYVLGCDGAGSPTRKAIGARMTDLGFTQRWLVVDVATTAELGQWDGIHQVCSPRRAASYMRIGRDRYRWEFQLSPGESAADLGSVDALRPLLRPWLRGTPNDELELVRITEYTFRAQLADRWRAGRVFLLGDAAHLTPPFIGQGMGAGLRDAANLSWKLAGVLRGDLPASDLDSYADERRPHARAMIGKAVALGRLMTRGGRAGELLRRTLVPRLAAGLGPDRFATATPSLRRSSLVDAGRGRRGLAGSLCPNVALDDTNRVDDVAGGRFALVTDQPIDPARSHLARRAGAVPVEVAPTDRLGRWMAAAGVHAALVRPDGAVWCAAADPQRALAPLVARGRA